MNPMRRAGLALVAGFLIVLPAVISFASRLGQAALSFNNPRVIVERALVLLAVAVTAAAFFLLARALRGSPGARWLLGGAIIYLIGGALVITAELTRVTDLESINASISQWIDWYVRLSLVAQATIGLGLVRSPKVASAFGWLTLIWGLGFLVFAFTGDDIYFPIMHHVMPLVIGAGLLFSRDQDTA